MTRASMTRCLVLFIALDALLGVLLIWTGTRPLPIVTVPGAPRATIQPGSPDEATLRQFAHFFAVNLDNFTPDTFPAQEALLRTLVTADSDIGPILEERGRLAREAGLGSSLFVSPEEISIEGHEARFTGLRRQYVGGRLSWEARFEYCIRMTIVPPTTGNPYALSVRHLTAKKVEHEVADAR